MEEDREQERRRSLEGVWETGEAEEIRKEEYARSLEGLGIWDTGEQETASDDEEDELITLLKKRIRGFRIDLFMADTKEVSKDAIKVRDEQGIIEEDIPDEENPDPVQLDVTDIHGQVVFRKDTVEFHQPNAPDAQPQISAYAELSDLQLTRIDQALESAATAFPSPAD